MTAAILTAITELSYAVAVSTPLQLEELGEVTFDRPPIGVPDDETNKPPHVRP